MKTRTEDSEVDTQAEMSPYDQSCDNDSFEQQGAIRRTYGVEQEPPTDKDLEITAELLVAAALEGHVWAIIEMGNGLDGEPI